MPTNEPTWNFELPDSLLTGTSVISKIPMKEVNIDFCVTPDVLLETPDGLLKLPGAEGLLVLLSNGWPAPNPMRIGLSQLLLTNGKVLLVCSELARNDGISVAKAWPQLAEHLLKIAGIAAPEQAVFVEHYFYGSYTELTNQTKDDFYLMEIAWHGNKAIERKWHHL